MPERELSLGDACPQDYLRWPARINTKVGKIVICVPLLSTANMQPWLAILLGGTVTVSWATPAHHASGYSHRSPSLPPLSGKHGGVVTEVGVCSDIGVNVLKEGGNAADAIISSALCVGTIAGYHSGIGGGGFMLVRFNDEEGSHSYEVVILFSF